MEQAKIIKELLRLENQTKQTSETEERLSRLEMY